jgi:hypothetical protein
MEEKRRAVGNREFKNSDRRFEESDHVEVEVVLTPRFSPLKILRVKSQHTFLWLAF